jgi:hypothetical protein
LAGHVPYAQLPPDQKQAIDTLYQAMMQQKRTILQVSTMAPKLLHNKQATSQADAAAGHLELPLASQVNKLNTQGQQLQQQLQTVRQQLEYTQSQYRRSTVQGFHYAKWPTEAVAARRNVELPSNSSQNSPKDAALQAKLRDLLDREAAHVDRIDRMPSPFLWQILEEMEQRLSTVQYKMMSTDKTIRTQALQPSAELNIVEVMELQEHSIWRLASVLVPLHEKIEQLRQKYRMYETRGNVLEEVEQQERQRQQQLDHQMRLQMVKTLPQRAAAAAPAPGGSMFGGAPSPGGGMFGSAPAPGGGMFGSAPAPGGSSLFGSSPAPAPGGLFGSSPAPAPSGGFFGSAPAAAPGGQFGSSPAPAPGGLFGSAPAPAPAGGMFGSAPAPAPGGLFGSAPAPAPAGGMFGSAPAPAPGGLFGSAPAPAAAPAVGFGSSTQSTPKSRNRKSSTRRR